MERRTNMENMETKDIKEIIVVKDGKIDRVPVLGRTTRTYKLGSSKRTGRSYRTTLSLSDANTVIGKGGGAYIMGEDIQTCVDAYNAHMSEQIDMHEKTIENLKSLVIEVSCNG